MSLLHAEHPPIGTVRLLGHTFWAGWLMVAAMESDTGIGPFILGRMSLPLAEQSSTTRSSTPTPTCRRPTG